MFNVSPSCSSDPPDQYRYFWWTSVTKANKDNNNIIACIVA